MISSDIFGSILPVVRERSCERDALLLAARQLVRLARRLIAEADGVEQRRHALFYLFRRHAYGVHGERDVFVYGLFAEQSEILEDDAEPAPVIWDAEIRQLRQIDAVDEDLARRRLFLAQEQLHYRRLACSRLTYYKHELAVLDLEIDSVERHRAVFISLDYVFEFDHLLELRRL